MYYLSNLIQLALKQFVFHSSCLKVKCQNLAENEQNGAEVKLGRIDYCLPDDPTYKKFPIIRSNLRSTVATYIRFDVNTFFEGEEE